MHYFALFREKANRSQEKIQTNSRTLLELYQELSIRYGFDLESNRIKAAVNEEFVKITSEIRNGDEVVFIPPVAGG